MKVISMYLQHIAIFLMLYDKRDWAILFNNYKALKPFVIQFLFGVIKKIHLYHQQKIYDASANCDWIWQHVFVFVW